eukprot:COSAG02_NODE_1960_length_10257_cov_48.153278_8_plen_114_part_00
MHHTSHPAPPASPTHDENDCEDYRDEATAETGRAAWAAQTNNPNEEAESGTNPRSRPGQRLSIKDQEELMAKLEADPDNMDLLMQLQEVHRSLSMVSSCIYIPFDAASLSTRL